MGFLASIIGRVELDGSGFQSGARAVENAATRMANNVGSTFRRYLGAAILVEATRRTINYASSINDMASRAGVGTEALQQMGYAAEQGGSKMETMVKFLEQVSIARAKALKGDKASAGMLENFGEFGVSKDNLKTERTEQVAMRLIQQVNSGDIQKLIAPLREIGGKGAGELVAAFRDEFEQKMKEAPLISAENIQALDAVGDQLDFFAKVMVSTLAPAIVFVTEKILTAVYTIKAEAARLGDLVGAKGGKRVVQDVAAPIAKSLVKNVATLKDAPSLALSQFGSIEKLFRAIFPPAKTGGEVGKALESIFSGNSQAANDVYKELADILGKLSAIKGSGLADTTDFEEGEAAAEKSKIERLDTDKLNKIGGFVGGAEFTMVAIAKEHTRILRNIEANTAQQKGGKPKNLIDG